MAITDHSASYEIQRRRTPDALRRRVEEIRALDVPEIRVLAGTETNVLPDGSLDYEDAVLEELDWVVASVHRPFRLEEESRRAPAARDGAPSSTRSAIPGRKIGRREPWRSISIG